MSKAKIKPWYHGVKVKEVFMSNKFYYCLVSGQAFVVADDKIVVRDGMRLTASEVFSIATGAVKGQGGRIETMAQIGVMKEVTMKCDFIAELTEDSQLYRIIRGKISGLELV